MIWQISPHPIAFSIFNLDIRWYGLAYAIGFLLILIGTKKLLAKNKKLKNIADDFLFYTFIAAIIGGRLGFIAFYRPDLWREFYAIWHGGMSFHGAILGVTFAIFWYIHRFGKTNILKIIATSTPFIALALALGRLANFANGELLGRCTNWGIIWSHATDCVRYPSQLIAAGKDIFLAIFLAILISKNIKPEKIIASFITGYGILRFFAEFVREPSWVWANLTAGQWLSLPMIIFGGLFLIFAKQNKKR